MPKASIRTLICRRFIFRIAAANLISDGVTPPEAETSIVLSPEQQIFEVIHQPPTLTIGFIFNRRSRRKLKLAALRRSGRGINNVRYAYAITNVLFGSCPPPP
jgi:hypothetical protein